MEEQPLTHVRQKVAQTVGPLQLPRAQHCSAKLPDGKLLFVGGSIDTNYSVTATTEAYDPMTKTSSFRPSMNVARRAAQCLTLSDGSLLVLGGVGGADSSEVLNTVEKYNPSTNTWTLLAPMPSITYGAAMTQLDDGRVLVAGGPGSSSNAYLFDPATNTWTTTGPLNVGRTYPLAIKLPDHRVLAIGGLGANGNRRALEVYTPSTGTWSVLASLLKDSGEPAAVLLPDGRIFVGEMDDSSTSAYAQVYDVSTNTWTLLPQANSPHGWGAKMGIVNGQPILVGGCIGAQMLIERFDFTQQQWTTVGQLGKQREGFTLDVLTDGSVLITGGAQWDTGQPYAEMALVTLDSTPPPPSTSPLTYDTSITNSAQQNTANRTFTLNAGDVLEVGTCNVAGSFASGDTYLRLFGGGTQVAYNDDSCGGAASYIQYTAVTTGTYELRAGCYSNGSCSGIVTFHVTPAKP